MNRDVEDLDGPERLSPMAKLLFEILLRRGETAHETCALLIKDGQSCLQLGKRRLEGARLRIQLGYVRR